MEDFVSFGSRDYLITLGLLVFARGMDFLSTWFATPTLALEANPLAKRLGWKWGDPVEGGIVPGVGTLADGCAGRGHDQHAGRGTQL